MLGWVDRASIPTVAIIEPPAPLLTASEVRSRLGVSDDDAVLSPLVKAVCATIEPPNGWIGRAFGLQTLEMRGPWFADDWGGCELRLRFPPFRSFVSLKYLDGGGVEQTIDPSLYGVIGATGTDVARLVLPYGGSWPVIRGDREAVRIRYTAGYDHDDPQLDAAKSAVALAVRNLRSLSARDLAISAENVPGVGSRNYIVTETASKVISGAVDGLLQGYRVYA
jgi:hypothetical protein